MRKLPGVPGTRGKIWLTRGNWIQKDFKIPAALAIAPMDKGAYFMEKPVSC
jgi:hypothetical protein